MKILVTGGSGFIGSELVRFLLEKNHKVINIDNLSQGSVNESLKFLKNNHRYKFVKCDIFNFKKVLNILRFEKPEAIFHLAAESHVDNSISSPLKTFNTNVMGTINLVESIRYLLNANLINSKKFRFIHVSTDEVYGSLDKKQKSSIEDSKYAPNSPYSASKASSDFVIKSWIKTYSFPGIITHCVNNYGPWQFPEKLIPVVIHKCLTNKKIPIYGDGKNIREWIFVKDHVRALYHIYKYGNIGEIYNIGTQFKITNLRLVKEICNVLNKINPKDYDYNKLISFVKDRPGHDFRYSLNSKKLQKLKYKNIFKFEESLFNTVDWYIKNYKWLEKKVNTIEK